jgi:hydrogenase large subunit
VDQGAALARPRDGGGPLARYIIGYQQGRKDIKEQVDGLLKTLDVPFEAIFSTLGRTAARALEAQWAAEKQKYFLDKLIANIKAGDTATANTAKFDPSTWPRSQGRGLHRGRAARWPLDPHQGRQDRQLPVRGAHHLERLAAR